MIGHDYGKGPSRIRTGDGGFAIRCLTAWLRGPGFGNPNGRRGECQPRVGSGEWCVVQRMGTHDAPLTTHYLPLTTHHAPRTTWSLRVADLHFARLAGGPADRLQHQLLPGGALPGFLAVAQAGVHHLPFAHV